ncbi:MAG: hypothetical protein AAGA92_02115 [Planctomycetota bacterium]
MAKNQNTVEKRRREIEKKRKAEEKRERRRLKKTEPTPQIEPLAGEPEQAD